MLPFSVIFSTAFDANVASNIGYLYSGTKDLIESTFSLFFLITAILTVYMCEIGKFCARFWVDGAFAPNDVIWLRKHEKILKMLAKFRNDPTQFDFDLRCPLRILIFYGTLTIWII